MDRHANAHCQARCCKCCCARNQGRDSTSAWRRHSLNHAHIQANPMQINPKKAPQPASTPTAIAATSEESTGTSGIRLTVVGPSQKIEFVFSASPETIRGSLGSLIKTRGNAALNANMTREITRGRRHRVPRPLPWNLKTLKWLRFASASGIHRLGADRLALFLRYF